MFLETIDQNLSLNCENSEQNNGNQGKVHKPLNLRNSLEKAKFQNVFLIWKQTLDEPSHFTTHNHVRWLHWWGLSKKPAEYIVPRRLKWFGTKNENQAKKIAEQNI